jgi:hypothetical protein
MLVRCFLKMAHKKHRVRSYHGAKIERRNGNILCLNQFLPMSTTSKQASKQSKLTNSAGYNSSGCTGLGIRISFCSNNGETLILAFRPPDKSSCHCAFLQKSVCGGGLQPTSVTNLSYYVALKVNKKETNLKRILPFPLRFPASSSYRSIENMLP